MTLPCGHTADDHAQLLARFETEAREDFTAWLRDAIAFDPPDWPDALIEMADIMTIGKADHRNLGAWRTRAGDWPDEILVLLIGMAAVAMDCAFVRLPVLLSEGKRLGAMRAATTMHVAMARQAGDDRLTDSLAVMMHELDPWERFVAVHFGSSALKTLGLGAADLLDVVGTITSDYDTD